MIQASAKYANLEINSKTPPGNRFNKILPNGKVWSRQRIFSNPFHGAFSNFTQTKFSSPQWEKHPKQTRSIKKDKNLNFS